MKLQLPILLLATVAECVPQLGGLLSGGTGWALVGKKEVKPLYRPNAKRTILKYGPLELAGKDAKKPGGSSLMAMDPKGQAGIASLNKGICTKCSILSARFLLTYEDGSEASPANGVYIHHFVSYDSSKSTKDVIRGCDGGFPGMRAPFIDRGEDSGDTDTIFTTVNGTLDSGYFMNSGSLIVQYDMVNYKEVTKKIFVNLEYEYFENQSGKDATHTLKSVTCQGLIGPRVAASGPSVTTSSPMSIQQDATIVWARGHLHAGGEKMIMSINGKVVCTSLPEYNSKGVITTMSLCPEPIPIKKGQSMTISSTYDLSKHKLRESTDGTGHGAQGKVAGSDVMGMFAISYAYN